MVTIPPGSALGRYRVIEQLGRGGMATVFRCHDPNLDRHVAVKVLPSFHTEDPTFTGRFTQEAQTVAKLNHPNILQIYDFGEDKGYTYIVTELVPGGDLQDMLDGSAMPVLEVLKFMGPLAEALDTAHRQGIVHRDLKPANVLLDNDGRAILADFGLARMLESTTRFTQASQALGTPEYMAPEQAMGADADHRSDLYAFGVMIYQMLLGQTPFRADTPAATLMAHVHQPLPLPTSLNPDIEPRMEAILLKALAKTPDDRFQSAREMIQALAQASDQVKDAAQGGDLGATAVLDIAAISQDEMMEAATAVMDAAPGTAAVEAAPGEAEAPPAGKRGLFLVIGGVAAAVVIAAVAAVVVLSGGDGDEGEGGAGTGAPSAPAQAAAAGGAGAAAAAQAAATGEGGAASPTGTEAPGAATGAAAAEPTAEPTATPVPAPTVVAMTFAEVQDLINQTHSNVNKVREISLDGQIATEFVERSELENITRGFFRRTAIRDQIFEAEQLYKTLDMMAENQDLEEILLAIQLQQVFALFDDVSDKLYVTSDATSIGALQELGIAAAYMAGVQQQMFDVAAMRQSAREIDEDQFRAVSAMIVGDVAQVATGYIGSYFSREQVAELQEPIPDNKLLAAPDVVQKANRFQRREGVTFIAELFGEAGWEGVNAAYENPPLSTEQVLHPEKYLEGEEPHVTTMPNIAADMGRGWEQVSANTMGEFLLRTYLEEQLDNNQAEEAAAGWGGDRYSLLSGPEAARLLVMQIRWDNIEDSKEFFDAYKLFVGLKTQGQEARTGSVGTTAWKSATAEESVFLGQQGPAIFLIIGPDEPTVEKALNLFLAWLQQAAQP